MRKYKQPPRSCSFVWFVVKKNNPRGNMNPLPPIRGHPCPSVVSVVKEQTLTVPEGDQCTYVSPYEEI